MSGTDEPKEQMLIPTDFESVLQFTLGTLDAVRTLCAVLIGEPATERHVYTLAANLRTADAEEILGAGHSIKKSLWRGYRNSVMCKSAIIHGEVAAMWGLCLNMRPGVSLLSDLGVPWLLTTAAVERLPFSFVKVAKVELAAMKALRRRLENHVTADYAQAIKFLRLIGFTVEAPAAGATGAMYCRFHLGFDG